VSRYAIAVNRAATHLRWGIALVLRDPGLYLRITLVYVAPALVAAFISAFVNEPTLWQQAIMLGLPWLTIVLGTVVIMVTIGYHVRRQPVGLVRATRVALRWVPRYVWTNVHTSLIFWLPMGALLAARRWQVEVAPIAQSEAAWWVVIAALGLYLHTRTVLAPFLAVHADLPGTLAALAAWRLAGRHFPVCLATLIVGTLPVGIPLALIASGLTLGLSGEARSLFLDAAPDLLWASIQLLRPVLIPTLYPLYHAIWQSEQAQFQLDVDGGLPAGVCTLLKLTERLPKLGSWD
jgi:hypothetical protein